MTEASQLIERLVREEWGRVLAILVSKLRDVQLAEDALQDALIAAHQQWNADALPANPSAWLLRVAQRKMIDQIRRRETFRDKQDSIIASLEESADLMDDDEAIPDERLRLICTCCHPALAEESRVALTLQTLGGLTTPEVARAFLVSEPTMAQRLVRAKRKIRLAGIPYEVPGPEALPERIVSVSEVIYLIFNEGYSASSGSDSVRVDLCREAVRLGRMLLSLAPAMAELQGLLALMLLHASRIPARSNSAARLIPLDEQDRSLWDQKLIAEGTQLLDDAMGLKQVGPYQIQAAISALHAAASDFETTDWKQIWLLYQRLNELQPSPVVALNGIVALSYAGGPDAALAALERLRSAHSLEDYLPVHAAAADFFRRMDRLPEATAAYQRCLNLAGTEAERGFFGERLRRLAGPEGDAL